MISLPKYALLEYLFVITQRHESVTEPCKVCDGTGELSLAKGGSVPCTERYRTCDGGRVTVAHVQPWGLFTYGMVGNVRFEVTAAQFRDHDEDLEPPHTEDERKVQYMLNTTGIGSGSLWDEERCFPSRQAALAECERRNAIPTLPREGAE